MSRGSSDREAIEAEIDRVRSLGLDELRTLWRVTFRSSPSSAFSKDLMARFLCWHIQERAQGGLEFALFHPATVFRQGTAKAEWRTRGILDTESGIADGTAPPFASTIISGIA